ncbi:DNA-directed RNA polymerase I subunit rpa49 [Apophysomyces ossiformis]|uniref:DNA-directed RNA polymerase I subunit rpa49 n=1 Tax=Apophysomyces ossiformis TaxID=679940 RepID=A0A8H7BYI3_9FUNG|nr:DNA-directed RNA polymerase I subunit rpa49 [Apophysomyces ossiformis]
MTKRKHSDEDKGHAGKYLKVNLAEAKPDVETPYLATFPGIQPPADTSFSAYRRSGSQTSSQKASHRVVSGETEKVVFSGANFGKDAANGLYCKYLVGVYSKKDQALTVTPASVLRMRRSVKALSSATTDGNIAANDFTRARAALGLAFGTAKAKQQLKDDERNKVTGEELEEEMPSIHHEIGKASKNTPKQADLRKDMENQLPVPAHNMDAESPEEAYDLSSIVTEEELNAMPVKDLLKETTLEGIQSHLPYGLSGFINDRILIMIKASGKKDRSRLRTLVYISHLMAYLCRVRPNDLKTRRKVESALNSPPTIVIDKLTERYTVSNVRTDLMKDKILCHLFVLCLSVANYSVVCDKLAKDLSMRPSKVITVFRNLGCKIEACNADERAAEGLDKSLAAKKATLVMPLKFPELRKAKRKN